MSKTMLLTRPASRRSVLLGLAAGGAVTLGSGRAVAATLPAADTTARLVAKAKAAMEAHGQRIAHHDRAAIADFSRPSSAPRFLLIDFEGGRTRRLRVAHGRGSDPAHSGWLQSFSNRNGSNASSRGAYATGALYSGQHGRSQRLIGLEPTNDQAEARAIVIHGAWYANDDIVSKHGVLGRSEGCFAVSESAIGPLLDWLGEGRLLYADKL